MKYSAYSFQMEINLTRQKFPFFLGNLMSFFLVTKVLRLNWNEVVLIVDNLCDAPEGAQGK